MKQIFKSAAIIAFLLLLGITALAQKKRNANPKGSSRAAINRKTDDLSSKSVRATMPKAPVKKVESRNLDGFLLITKTNKVQSDNSIYNTSRFEGLPMEAQKIAPDNKTSLF